MKITQILETEPLLETLFAVTMSLVSQIELLLRCVYLSLTGTVDMNEYKVAVFGYGGQEKLHSSPDL